VQLSLSKITDICAFDEALPESRRGPVFLTHGVDSVSEKSRWGTS